MRRTKVANGKALLSPEAGHGNGWWARRYAEILELRLDDLGGGATLSEGQISLSKRATTLEIELERMDADLSAGKDVPLKVYAEVTGQLVRVLNALGLKRVPRPAVNTVLDHFSRPPERAA